MLTTGGGSTVDNLLFFCVWGRGAVGRRIIVINQYYIGTW